MKALRLLTRSVLAVALALSTLGISLAAFTVPVAYAYDDGVYQIEATVDHATQAGQKSMATAAFDNVLQNGVSGTSDTRLLTLVVKDGKAYLETHMLPIQRKLGKTGFTGYLGYLDYYPTYHGAATPLNKEATAALTDSYYSLTDSYNNAKTGTDAALKGQKYPEVMSMQIDTAYSVQWIQVYVPVMESISAGSGTQYAKLTLDYSSMTRVEDEGQIATAEGIATRHAQAVDGGYQDLATELTTASKTLLQTSTYTSASLATLRTARNSAQTLYEARSATPFAVMKALVTLATSRGNLVRKASSSSSSSGSSSSGKSSSSKSKLKFSKLKDGTYTVYGEMIKTDRQQQSMSNAAIDHNIRIKVKNGKYTVQMTFTVLHYSGKTGALGKLWYFKSGYKHENGSLSGTRARVKVLSYLTTSSGKRFSDEYGTNYPKTMSFPLISEAKSDGWVPLQVFVPVMEGISAGTGTQGVYLRLHTDTVVSGSKKVSGSSTGTSSESTGSGSSASEGSDDESGSTDMNGLLGETDSDDDGGDASADDSASGDAAQDGATSSDAQQTPAAVAANEPPLRRYLGLLVGIPALCACLGCAWYLFRRRSQIASLVRTRP